MSIRRPMMTVALTLTVVAGVTAATALPASAATMACGTACGSVFSDELGTYAAPGPVEDVLGGVAEVGQPVILKQASNSDSSEDIIPHRKTIPGFYAAGMVSKAVDDHYRHQLGVQQEYAPDGVPTGLCVGLASPAYQNEGLTLQPCTVPGVTVFVLDFPDSPSTVPNGIFPIVNASTTDFTHPFAMDLPADEVHSAQHPPQILMRRLQFLGDEKTLPVSQLWGFISGVL